MGFPIFSLKKYFYKTEIWTIIYVHFSKYQERIQIVFFSNYTIVSFLFFFILENHQVNNNNNIHYLQVLVNRCIVRLLFIRLAVEGLNFIVCLYILSETSNNSTFLLVIVISHIFKHSVLSYT
jgi:hypothetical protein